MSQRGEFKVSNQMFSLVTYRLAELQNLVLQHSSYQNTLLRQVNQLTQGIGESTPRFFMSQEIGVIFTAQQQQLQEPIRSCILTIKNLHAGLCKLFDTEHSIVGQYKNYVQSVQKAEIQRSPSSSEVFSNLQFDYEEQKGKVQKLKRQLQNLQQKMDNLQDIIEDLREDRDLLQKQVNDQSRQDCPDCPRIKSKYNNTKERINELIYEMEEQKKNIVNLTEEIRKNQEEKKKLVQENQKIQRESQAQNLSDLENEIRELRIKVTVLEQERIRLAENNDALLEVNESLSKRFDDTANQTQGLARTLQEMQSQLQEKQTALDKAKTIIKKLNNECQRLVKVLYKTQSELQELKKEHRHADRSWVGVQKQIKDFDILKKTQQRLRQQLASLKEKHQNVIQKNKLEVQSLNSTIEKLIYQKTQLEGVMEQLQEKLRQIDRISQDRITQFYGATQRIKELQQLLNQKNLQIKQIQQFFQAKDSQREHQISHWKKQSENVIRHLHSLQQQSNLQVNNPLRDYVRNNRQPLKQREPKKSAFKIARQKAEGKQNIDLSQDSANQLLKNLTVSQNTVDNLAAQLEAALDRQKGLKATIAGLLQREAKHLQRGVQSLKNGIGGFKPELERWIMRNEELQQRLLEMFAKNSFLRGIIRDLKKTMHVKNMQLEEQQQLYQEAMGQINTMNDFLQTHFHSLAHEYSSDILPRSESTLKMDLSDAHQKIRTQFREISDLKAFSQGMENALKSQKDQHSRTKDELDLKTQAFFSTKRELQALQHQLQPKQLTEPARWEKSGFSDPTQEALSAIQDLHNDKFQLHQVRENLKNTKDKLDNLMQRYAQLEEVHQKKQQDWNSQGRSLREQIGKLSIEISQEKQDKYRQSLKLEDHIHTLKSELQEYKTLAMTIENQKTMLESDFHSLKETLQDTQNRLDNQTRQLGHLQVLADRKSSTINTLQKELDLVAHQLTMYKTDPKVHNLKDILDQREKTINSLRHELKDIQQEKFTISRSLQDRSRGWPMEQAVRQGRDQFNRIVENDRVFSIQEEFKKLQKENIQLKGQLQRAEIQGRSLTKDTHQLQNIIGKQREIFHGKASGGKDPYTSHLQELLAEKNKTITQLQRELAQYQIDTFRPRTGDAQRELERVLKKSEQQKASFAKRLKEFELILRFLQQKINKILNPNQVPAESVASSMKELAEKNPNIDFWISLLTGKLDSVKQQIYLQNLREIHSYTQICKVLNQADARPILNALSTSDPDLQKIASWIVQALGSNVRSSRTKHHKRKGVLLTVDHADLLVSTSVTSQQLLASLAEKSNNIRKISAKSEEIMKIVNEKRLIHDPTLPAEIIRVFHRFFYSFVSDLETDTHNASALNRHIQEILGSNPRTHSMTMAKHADRSTIKRHPPTRPEEPPALIHQTEILKQRLLKSL